MFFLSFRLSRDEIDDIRSHIRGTRAPLFLPVKKYYDAPKHGWTCFHCGETFKTKFDAQMHFGTVDNDRPVCVETQDGRE